MDLSEVVAENVRALRARKRIHQRDLAAAIGWTRPSVSSLEAGARRVTLNDAVALCTALDVSLRELLEGADAGTLAALGLD